MKTLLELKDKLDFPVKLEQAANGTFRVTYGMSVKSNLQYGEAAREFGYSVFHSLTCTGELDNSGLRDDRVMYMAPDSPPRRAKS